MRARCTESLDFHTRSLRIEVISSSSGEFASSSALNRRRLFAEHVKGWVGVTEMGFIEIPSCRVTLIRIYEQSARGFGVRDFEHIYIKQHICAIWDQVKIHESIAKTVDTIASKHRIGVVQGSFCNNFDENHGKCIIPSVQLQAKPLVV